MIKQTLILSFILLNISALFGQTLNDSITTKKVWGGYQFLQNDKALSLRELSTAVKSNPEAYSQIKSAQANETLATIIGAAGGFMVGFPVGTALGGGEPEWALAGIGAGLIVVSIPIINKASRQAKAAVTTYNSGLNSSSFWDDKKLDVTASANGVGFSLTF